MQTFTFEGFATSSVVAISAIQGALNASGSMPAWGLSATNTASLDIRQNTPAELVAPVGIWFEATDIVGFAVSEPEGNDRTVYDPTAHDITYIWDFDDPGTFTAPLNMPMAWNNKNVDYGKKAYHVFDTPGTYVVRLWAIDREGTTGERMVSVTVADPDEVYTGVRTICVSNQGDFTGAPAGARKVFTLAAARDAYRVLRQTGRILIRRGETYQETYEIDEQLLNQHIGAFGAVEDGKPILRPPLVGGAVFTAAFNRQLPLAITYWGLRFEGEWDAAKETGDPRGEAINFHGYNVTNDWNSLIYQCDFNGLDGLLPYSPFSTFTSAVVDCDITNWRFAGIYFAADDSLGPSYFAVVGSAVHQKENACKAGFGDINLTNELGALRLGSVRFAVVSACDFYSASSWFDTTYVQPALRLFTSGGGNTGGWFLNANRIAAEGGWDVILLDGQNPGTPEIPGNHIFDMVLAVGDYETSRIFRLDYGGTTVRNALCVFPNLTRGPGVGMEAAYAHVNDNNTPENIASVMNIYNCTAMNLMDGTSKIVESRNPSNFTNRIAENNLLHQPNLMTPDTPDAPIDLTHNISGFTPRNRGLRASVEKPFVSAISVPDGATLTIAYPDGTGEADFSPSGRHTIRIGDWNHYFSYRGDCSLFFGVSEIIITNTSGQAWSGDARIALDQDTLTTDTSLGSPTSLPLPVPGMNSPAFTANGAFQSHTQFATDFRTVPRGAL